MQWRLLALLEYCQGRKDSHEPDIHNDKLMHLIKDKQSEQNKEETVSGKDRRTRRIKERK